MRRVAKGAVVGVVRRDDNDLAAGREQAVEFFHCAYYIGHMFYHMNRTDLAKGVISEGKGIVIDVGDDVSTGVWISINADRAGILVSAAANIEHRQVRLGLFTQIW